MWTYQFIAIGMQLAAVLLIGSAPQLPQYRHLLRPLAALLILAAIVASLSGAGLTFASRAYSVADTVLITAFAAIFTASAVGLLGLFGLRLSPRRRRERRTKATVSVARASTSVNQNESANGAYLPGVTQTKVTDKG